MKNIISVIGAGGKTSLLHKMSDYYLEKKRDGTSDNYNAYDA